MADEVVIEVKLEDGSYRKAWVNLEKDSKDSGKRAGDNLGEGVSSGFETVIKKIAAVTVAYLGLRELTGKVAEGIKAAIGTENAFQELNLALAQNGNYSEQAAEHLHGFIDGLEKTTAVSDTVITKGASLLAGLGRLSGEGLDRATKSALDLAAGLHKGPEEAFDIMAKAAEGNLTALNKYGFKLIDTGDKAADFARVMDQVNARFGGMAENRLNTFGGAIEKLGVSFDNFLKNIGFAFTKSTILQSVIKDLGALFDRLGSGVDALSKNGNVIDQVILKLLELAQVMTQYVIPPFELLYNVAMTVFNAIRTGIQFALVTVAQTVLGLIEPITAVTGKFTELRDGLQDFVGSSQGTLSSFADQTSESFNKIFDFGATDAISEKITAYKNAASEIVATHTDATSAIIRNQQKLGDPTFMDLFIQQWHKANNSVKEIAGQMVQTIRGGLVNGLGNGFAAVGKALVSGENLFAAFGKAILQSFGQVLIQLGTQTLAVGLLMSTVPILFGLQGGAAIAAGIGMIIAGGALTALAGGGGGSGGGSGGAAAPTGLGPGGGIAVSPVGGGLADQAASAPQKPGTNLVVQIQGNVFDRKSTGLEIADILRENFELHGVTFAGNAAL